jgi:hypothetical protein
MADFVARALFRALGRLKTRYRSPTRSWPPTAVPHLFYDMGTRALCGVPVDAPLEALKCFGPADWFYGNNEDLDLYYYQLGLIVGLWQGEIVSFEVLLHPELCPGRAWHPFAAGRLTLCSAADVQRDPTGTTSEREVLSLLGAPAETGPIQGQRVHSFIVAGNFIDTYHDPESGRLVRIELGEAGPWSTPAAA